MSERGIEIKKEREKQREIELKRERMKESSRSLSFYLSPLYSHSSPFYKESNIYNYLYNRSRERQGVTGIEMEREKEWEAKEEGKRAKKIQQ